MTHPEPQRLERFLAGELPAAEARNIVRHLLKGCPPCQEVSRPLWAALDRLANARLAAPEGRRLRSARRYRRGPGRPWLSSRGWHPAGGRP